ncbi:SMP-30/gluconolactonase/LRE family protein [Paenibacillus aquistagni]|uniref:Sugar lactone lactonase YvrE n=1 Tax=Paenibacillus aquistagni TaxID=1852522 RepID=A0A1X7IRF7_9BACL|nr:SMP-30/gluconolactonase/LRE family protein [Paenibacillus aquistagni]SMG17573.1 Sugar lactone lactonase YvrE [Paenibacillus aquistagni]
MNSSKHDQHSTERRSNVFTSPHGFTAGIEGPACDAQGNLYAVNYEREGTIGRVTPEGECSVFLELPEGSIANGIRFMQDGSMLMADYTGHNILKADLETREITVHAHEAGMNQPNDICIMANDIVFASDPNWSNDTGQIWRITPDGSITLLEKDMGTTNGIEVSPTEDVLYVNESVQRTIWAYDLDRDGQISNKRLFKQFEDFGMDGMRCDVDGNLYVTRFGKGTIVVLSPQGEMLEEILLTGKNCTNLTFGGPDGCTVYVTIADQGNVEMFEAKRPGRCRALLSK